MAEGHSVLKSSLAMSQPLATPSAHILQFTPVKLNTSVGMLKLDTRRLSTGIILVSRPLAQVYASQYVRDGGLNHRAISIC